MRLIFFLVLTLCLAPAGFFSAHAQTTLEESLPTRKVDKKIKENKRSNFPKEKKIRFIYVKDGKKVLYGNPCATHVTHSFGFEYGIEHRPDTRFVHWWRRFKTNTSTKSILFFTKGPWWKSSVKRKLRQCVQSSGDRRG